MVLANLVRELAIEVYADVLLKLRIGKSYDYSGDILAAERWGQSPGSSGRAPPVARSGAGRTVSLMGGILLALAPRGELRKSHV